MYCSLVGREAIDSIDLELGSLATFLERVAEAPTASPEALFEIAESDPDLEVVGTLGAGGMGVVFLARDKRLDRQVAVKIHRHADRPEAGARVLSEARAMARLSHPNIVSVFEVREIGDHVVVIMEYVKGQTLDEWLAAEDRELGDIARVFREAGAGLQAAHTADLVHRDFKPANVIVGDDGRVRVADFGIAVIGNAQGSVAGTPAYMAPEQLAQGVVDARADQFAFCTALAEATETIHDNSRLSALIERGQMTDPQRRWSGMAEVVDELRKAAAVAGPRWPLSGKLLVGATGVIALGLSVRHFAAADSPDCSVEANAMSERWNADAREQLRTSFASTNRTFATDYANQLSTGFDQIEKRWKLLRRSSCEEGNAQRSLCLDGHLSRANALLKVLAQATPAVVDHGLDLFDSLASPACESSVQWPRTNDNASYLKAVSALEHARIDRVLGNTGRGAATLEEISSIVSALDEPTLRVTLAAQRELAGLGRSTLTKNDLASLEAATAVELELARAADLEPGVLRERVVELERQRLLQVVLESAWLSLAVRSPPGEKIALLRRALESRRTRLGPSNGLLYPIVSKLGAERAAADQHVEARPYLAEALVLVENNKLGDEALRKALEALGETEQQLANRDEALKHFERLLAMTEKSDPRHWAYVGELCIAHVNNGSFDQAIPLCRRAIAGFEKQSRGDLKLAEIHENLGRVMIKMDRYRESHDHFKRASLLVVAHSSDPYERVEAHFGLIQSLGGLGRKAEAIAILDRWHTLGDRWQQKHLKRLRQRLQSSSF